MEYNEQNLRTLHAQGLSFTKIAAQLGVSRSAISGKVSRLGLSRRSLLAKAETNVVASTEKKLRKPRLRQQASPAAARTPAKITSSFGTLPAVATRPARYVEPTKAELREMLRQAVENTATPTRGLK